MYMGAQSAFPNKLLHLVGTINSYASGNKREKSIQNKGRKEYGKTLALSFKILKVQSIYSYIVLIIFHEVKKFEVVLKIQINISGIVNKEHFHRIHFSIIS